MLLRDNLQPTDFADSECRVTEWRALSDSLYSYRIWICRCTNFWFQRHEWLENGKNQSYMDDWMFRGYHKHSLFTPKMIPAPNMDDI